MLDSTGCGAAKCQSDTLTFRCFFFLFFNRYWKNRIQDGIILLSGVWRMVFLVLVTWQHNLKHAPQYCPVLYLSFPPTALVVSSGACWEIMNSIILLPLLNFLVPSVECDDGIREFHKTETLSLSVKISMSCLPVLLLVINVCVSPLLIAPPHFSHVFPLSCVGLYVFVPCVCSSSALPWCHCLFSVFQFFFFLPLFHFTFRPCYGLHLVPASDKP